MMTLRDRVDPELLPALDFTTSRLGRDFMGSGDAPGRRARFAEFLEQIAPAEPILPHVQRLDRTIPGSPGEPQIPIRVYRSPLSPPGTAGILFLHGGGFNIGSVGQEDAAAAFLCSELKVVVVSVEYRLAPEHPHPAPVTDCYTALCWMADQAVSLGVDRARIAVYGHSAGGGLAANVALMARDRAFPHISYQMLCYPMLDDRMSSPSFERLAGLGVWDLGANTQAWRALLGSTPEPDSGDVPAYAVAARAADLSRLPAAYIDVGDLDILLDQDLAYAQRLMNQDVPVEVHVYPGAYHGFDAFAPSAQLSQRAIQSRLAALRRALAI
jgi:acetyl esterase/lipase